MAPLDASDGGAVEFFMRPDSCRYADWGGVQTDSGRKINKNHYHRILQFLRCPPCRSGSSARRRARSPRSGISGLLERLAADRPDTPATCVTPARAPAVSFSSIPGVHSVQPPFIAKKPQGRRDRPQRLNPLSLALLAALACVPGVSGAQDARPDPPSAGATAAPAGGDAPELAGVTVTA